MLRGLWMIRMGRRGRVVRREGLVEEVWVVVAAELFVDIAAIGVVDLGKVAVGVRIMVACLTGHYIEDPYVTALVVAGMIAAHKVPWES